MGLLGKLKIWSLSIISIIISYFAIGKYRKDAKVAEQDAKEAREVIEDVKTANDARGSVRDTVERRRLLDKFTKK